MREGRALIEFCAAELDAVGGDLEELRLDELVARLEGEHGGGAADGAATTRSLRSRSRSTGYALGGSSRRAVSGFVRVDAR